MEAFSRAQLERVDGELVRYATARFPEEAERLGATPFRAKVVAARQRCQDFGFRSTEAFTQGVDFAGLYGDGWFDEPWAASMLKAPFLPESIRLEVLKKAAQERPR